MKIAVISGNFLAGVATDEENPDLQVDQLAKSLTFALAPAISGAGAE